MVNYEAQLDATFLALAHPARRTMLSRLSRGEATVGELAEPLDLSLPAVTKHLKVLQRAGLVHQGRQAQWRPCRLEPAPLQEASGWIEEQRRTWEARFDRLDAYLRELQQQGAQSASTIPTPEGEGRSEP